MSKKQNKKQKFNQKKKGSDDFIETGDASKGMNDITWWNQNPALLKDASALSYGNIAGNNVNFDIPEEGGRPIRQQSIPGIMAFNFIPIIGISKDGNSPVNNASRLLYTFVRHANSGSRNYEQSDLFTYVLAVSNLLTMHAELTRLYGIAQVYHKTNRFVGKALIECLGYDYDDVVNKLATLRYGLNALAVRINSLAIPKNIYLFARHIMLTSNIFKDSSDSKGQLYVFKPTQIFKWSAVGPDGTPGSSLQPLMLPTYNTTGSVLVEEALAFLRNLIDALTTNEDCGLMSGDILKAFGDGNLYHINAIPENYIVCPIYDQVMLSQIHNMDITSVRSAGLPNTDDLWITQHDNNILYNPQIYDPFGDSSVVLTTGVPAKILDSGMESPTPEYNMEATRFKVSIVRDVTNDRFELDSCGTELITSASIYCLQSGVVKFLTTITPYLTLGGMEAENITLATEMLYKSSFDWAPLTYVFDVRSEELILSVSGELFNYTLINNEYIRKVNNAALLSILNVYSMAMSKA